MGSRGFKAALTDKHMQAIELLSEGTLSLTEIGSRVGFSKEYLSHLQNANPKTGELGKMFVRELEKLEKKKDKDIEGLIRLNKKKAMSLLTKCLNEFDEKPALTTEDKKVLNSMSTALARLSPAAPRTANISYHQHYTGLTPQEMLYEFNRLRGAAEGALDPGRIRAADEGRPGEIFISSGTRGEAEEEPEDFGLSADAETA